MNDLNSITIDNFVLRLTLDERKYLLQRLNNLILGEIDKSVKLCPCCAKSDFKKIGIRKEVQRYKCTHTSKVFTYKTRLVISGIKKLNKLESLMDMMTNQRFPKLREIRETLGVSIQTAHDWRNKILTALFQEVNTNDDIIELDEKHIMRSDKGRYDLLTPRKRGGMYVGDNQHNVKVFIIWSRTNMTLELYQSHMGKTLVQDVENFMGPKKNQMVYTDMLKAYKQYFRKRGIPHQVFKSSDHVSHLNREVHNQNINYHCRILNSFLNDELKGVSTKYLQGYLNWYMFIHNVIKKKQGILKDQIVNNKVALDVYKQKEREFQLFLKNNKQTDEGKFKDKYYPRKLYEYPFITRIL